MVSVVAVKPLVFFFFFAMVGREVCSFQRVGFTKLLALIVVALKLSFLCRMIMVFAVNGLAFSGLASALDCFGSAGFPAPVTVLF